MIKQYSECLNVKNYGKKHVTIYVPQNIPITSNTLMPSFLQLSETLLEVFFRESLASCPGCLDVLSQFKMFLPGHFDFEEEAAADSARSKNEVEDITP